MVQDIIKNIKMTDKLISQNMNKPKFILLEVVRDYTSKAKQISKMCDYVDLFSKVNRELIDDDLRKKKINKKTRRYPISDLFIRVTESMEKILTIIKKLKVVSISSIQHKDGEDFPYEKQTIYQNED